jgi:hypothetical protein
MPDSEINKLTNKNEIVEFIEAYKKELNLDDIETRIAIDNLKGVANNLLDNTYNLQKNIVNQNKNIIANASNNAKGAFGEITSDAFLTEKGYQPLHPRKTALTQGWGESGIDGAFVKDGQYYIVEAKYRGQAALSTLSNGTKQMSDEWIQGSNRLVDAVGKVNEQEILKSSYRRILAETTPDGTVIYKELDTKANVIGTFNP